MMCKPWDKGENIFNIDSNWLRQGAQKSYLEDYSYDATKSHYFWFKEMNPMIKNVSHETAS